MKKKIVLIAFLILGTVNTKAYAYRVIRPSENDYIEKMRSEQLEDIKMNLLFESIEKENMNALINQLGLDEKLGDEKAEEKREGVYGPAVPDFEAEYTDIWKAGVNETDKFGYSPIIKSIIYKNDDVTELLLKNGASVNMEHPGFGLLTLHTAAYYDNEKAVKLLLEKGAGIVNVQSKHDGRTVLHEAVLKNNAKIVEMLLGAGANPRIKDAKGGTPMDMATEFGKGKIVKMLRNKIKEGRR